jgi:hypothetical protein
VEFASNFSDHSDLPAGLSGDLLLIGSSGIVELISCIVVAGCSCRSIPFASSPDCTAVGGDEGPQPILSTAFLKHKFNFYLTLLCKKVNMKK